MNRRHRKRVLIAGLALILILSGLALIYMGFRLKWQESKVQGHLLDRYREQVALGILPEIRDPDTEMGDLPSDDEDSSDFDLDRLTPLSLLTIPRIDLEVVVVEGVMPADLRFAVGHFPGTGLPGEPGNFALTGHRTYVAGQFFRRLDELVPGDEMIVDYYGERHLYEVTESFVVRPHEIWVLDSSEEAEITLITCTPPRSTSHRLIIKGRLAEDP